MEYFRTLKQIIRIKIKNWKESRCFPCFQFLLPTELSSSSKKLSSFGAHAIGSHHPPFLKVIVICRSPSPLVGVLELESLSHSSIHISVISTYTKVLSHTLASPFFYLFNTKDLDPPHHLGHQVLRLNQNLVIPNDRTNPKISFSRTPFFNYFGSRVTKTFWPSALKFDIWLNFQLWFSGNR